MLIIRSVIKIILITTLFALVTACETTRETKTTNIGTSSTSQDNAGFDKKKAANNRVNSALTYLSRNNFERARFHLDRALQYDPASGDVNYAFGLYYQRVKESDKAKKHFSKALDIDRKNPIYLNAYGAYLCEQGSYIQADEMFFKAIQIPTYTDVAFAFYNVGFCALKQNDVVKAENYFRKALNRNRRMTDALIEMSKIEFSKKRYSRANGYLKRFESSHRKTAESAWLGLRLAHYLRDKDAIASYGVLLEQRFPDSDETATYLNEKKRWM